MWSLIHPPPPEADELPDALVFKNIHYSCTERQFLWTMSNLCLPLPYAFNYLFRENGLFSGLAFANFKSPDDARVVISVMSFAEICDRPLKVEYKKVRRPTVGEDMQPGQSKKRSRQIGLEYYNPALTTELWQVYVASTLSSHQADPQVRPIAWGIPAQVAWAQ
jgi:hypothetical protein